MFKISGDTIQFWILIVGILGVAGSLVGWAQGHFASNDRVDGIQRQVTSEVSERRELKSEVDDLYHYLLPHWQQRPIRYPGSK